MNRLNLTSVLALLFPLALAGPLRCANPASQQDRVTPKFCGGEPDFDLVPNEDTAVRVAAAVLYSGATGEESEQERRLAANLRVGGVWVVSGVSPEGKQTNAPQVEIARKEGFIIKIREPDGRTREGDIVPNELAAVRFAEAVLSPIYGRKHIERERPFRAVQKDSQTWSVKGTLPKGFAGGTALVEISREGRILTICHWK